MSTFNDTTFEKQYIDIITCDKYENCTFQNCTISVARGLNMEDFFIDCTLEKCKIINGELTEEYIKEAISIIVGRPKEE